MWYRKKKTVKRKRGEPLNGRERRKVLIGRLDNVVSLYVRLKSDFRCVACGRSGNVRFDVRGLPTCQTMTCSHFHSRRKMSVRWDLDNLDCLCLGCHMRVENEKHDDTIVTGGNVFNYNQYMLKKLGDVGLSELSGRANMAIKLATIDLEIMYGNFVRDVNKFLVDNGYSCVYN